jgi:hypothetical protein
VVLWLYALVSIPLYLWFLHHMDLRFWLPIVVPLAAFSFTTMSTTSWWWSTENRPFLLGRKHWRFMMVFVVALSLMAGFFGSAHQDFGTAADRDGHDHRHRRRVAPAAGPVAAVARHLAPEEGADDPS